eukprot:2038151-Karenia_brevis.AAC.1
MPKEPLSPPRASLGPRGLDQARACTMKGPSHSSWPHSWPSTWDGPLSLSLIHISEPTRH